jgi:prephenate dehydratase
MRKINIKDFFTRDRKALYMILVLVLVSIFSLTIVYAALSVTLNIIGSYGFNMKSLRSRLMKELIWNYYFLVEIEGSINSQDGKDMLRALQVFCDKLKVVGTYNINNEK